MKGRERQQTDAANGGGVSKEHSAAAEGVAAAGRGGWRSRVGAGHGAAAAARAAALRLAGPQHALVVAPLNLGGRGGEGQGGEGGGSDGHGSSGTNGNSIMGGERRLQPV